MTAPGLPELLRYILVTYSESRLTTSPRAHTVSIGVLRPLTAVGTSTDGALGRSAEAHGARGDVEPVDSNVIYYTYYL